MGRKILIVVDVQQDFVYGSLGSSDAQYTIPNIVEKVKSYKPDYVFYTRDTHQSNYLETLEGQKLPVPHCIEGTKGWEVVDELKPFIVEDSQYIDKPTFGYHWENMTYKFRPDDEFEFVGFCTDICVVSNVLALRALRPNAKITVDASCCAGTSFDKHLMALEIMKSCQIDVINEEFDWEMTYFDKVED